MTALIITHSDDNESIEMVRDALKARGAKSVRFDTDRFPVDIRLEVYQSGSGTRQYLITEKETLDLSAVTSIWYRRIAIGEGIPTSMDEQLRDGSIQES